MTESKYERKISFRLPSDLHAALTERAYQDRNSLNRQVVRALWEHVGRPDQAAAVPETNMRQPGPRRS